MSTATRPAPPAAESTSTDKARKVILTGAGRCVACGLCLPHCPTYGKTKSELESPRGRLSLMLALAKDELEPTPRLESHLSLCLMCRACESVCPAQVPFGDVMDATRERLEARRPASWLRRAGLHAVVLLTQAPWTAFSARLVRFYQRSGLQLLLRRSGILKLLGVAEADAELAPLAAYAPLAAHTPARGKKRGNVALFTGCIARLTDTQTLQSTIRVLSHLGYDVHVPPTQTCCGALHRHAGDALTADKLMRGNLEAFAADDIEAVITTASGCAVLLVEYRGSDAAARFAAKVMDVSTFLQRQEWPTNIKLDPLPKRIAVHDPCSLNNVLHASQAPKDLLRRIPQAEVSTLADNKFCCGGAGAYHLEHKAMAQSLRQDKIENLRREAPEILATSNIGCAMHLAAGIRAAGLPIEVAHPITLLARQLHGD